MALMSKIARLPRSVREELNTRLSNGELGPTILPWINALPEVRKVLEQHFGGADVSSQNLSTWRETGYCEWQTNMDRVHRLRSLSEMAVQMGGNASKLFAGGAAIAGGHIMELLETLDPEQQKALLLEHPETFTELLDKLARLQKSQAESERNQLAKRKLDMDAEKLVLDRAKFEISQANALLKYAQSAEVQKVLQGNASRADKIKMLREFMFPKRPTTQTTTP